LPIFNACAPRRRCCSRPPGRGRVKSRVRQAGRCCPRSPDMTPMDYARAREKMVEQQVRPWDVLDVRVLDVLVRMPREVFVPEACRALAYADLPLPIGHGEVMFKPVVEGRALQAMAIEPGDSVLEIGTGTGWLAACMGRLA